MSLARAQTLNEIIINKWNNQLVDLVKHALGRDQMTFEMYKINLYKYRYKLSKFNRWYIQLQHKIISTNFIPCNKICG